VDGGEYLWADRRPQAEQPTFLPVRFVSYDPCPAFVILRDAEGVRRRCPRDEVFVIASRAPLEVARPGEEAARFQHILLRAVTPRGSVLQIERLASR
jgi:hypothetical protein